MELQNRHRQAIDDYLPIGRCLHQLQQHPTDEVEGRHQVPSSPIEATLRRQVGEEIAMLLPVAQQGGFHIPSPALPDQGQGEQFAVRAAGGSRTGTAKERRELLPDIIHDHERPQAKVIKVGYHHMASGVVRSGSQSKPSYSGVLWYQLA
jgi:hypothetical protein